MRDVVRRAIDFVVETLAFFVVMLFVIWTVYKLHIIAFSLVVPPALAKPGICNRRNIHRGV